MQIPADILDKVSFKAISSIISKTAAQYILRFILLATTVWIVRFLSLDLNNNSNDNNDGGGGGLINRSETQASTVSIHRDLRGSGAIQTVSGGKQSLQISSLGNEPGRGHTKNAYINELKNELNVYKLVCRFYEVVLPDLNWLSLVTISYC